MKIGKILSRAYESASDNVKVSRLQKYIQVKRHNSSSHYNGSFAVKDGRMPASKNITVGYSILGDNGYASLFKEFILNLHRFKLIPQDYSYDDLKRYLEEEETDFSLIILDLVNDAIKLAKDQHLLIPNKEVTVLLFGKYDSMGRSPNIEVYLQTKMSDEEYLDRYN